jgi:hypothetical protein
MDEANRRRGDGAQTPPARPQGLSEGSGSRFAWWASALIWRQATYCDSSFQKQGTENLNKPQVFGLFDLGNALAKMADILVELPQSKSGVVPKICPKLLLVG